MGLVILLFIIFIITVIVMIMNPPDTMGEEESYKAKVKDLWGIVKLCQTASYGFPTIELRPAKRSVMMDMDFINADTVSMSLPLLLKKQQKAKAAYLKLFAEKNLKVAELENKLIIHIDRNNENLGELIEQLYKEIFEATENDIVKFSVKTLKSDMRVFTRFQSSTYKFYDSYTFKAPSAKHKGKSVFRVISERILGAAYFLLYPPLIVLSYKFGGLTGMCWSALIFFSFFAVYDPFFKKKFVLDSVIKGSILYVTLLSVTLVTQKVIYLQSIPSVIGISSAVMAATLVLGIRQPRSEGDIIQKRERSREFVFMNSFWIFGGIGLFLMSEWARRNLEFDAWISFFAFVRIELMLVMVVIFTPAYALFLKSQKNINN